MTDADLLAAATIAAGLASVRDPLIQNRDSEKHIARRAVTILREIKAELREPDEAPKRKQRAKRFRVGA